MNKKQLEKIALAYMLTADIDESYLSDLGNRREVVITAYNHIKEQIKTINPLVAAMLAFKSAKTTATQWDKHLVDEHIIKETDKVIERYQELETLL